VSHTGQVSGMYIPAKVVCPAAVAADDYILERSEEEELE
jgi:hypothetical protein